MIKIMKEIDILGKKFVEGLRSEYHVESYRHITGRGLVSTKQFCLRATSWRDSDGDYHHSWMDGRHDPSRFIPMYKRIAAILMGVFDWGGVRFTFYQACKHVRIERMESGIDYRYIDIDGVSVRSDKSGIIK